jgi:hypothetical protein
MAQRARVCEIAEEKIDDDDDFDDDFLHSLPLVLRHLRTSKGQALSLQTQQSYNEAPLGDGAQ